MSFVNRVAGEIAESRPEAGGPWDASIQHGAAPAALAAWAIERCPAETPMRLVRMTLNLMRPVPIAPLRLVTNVSRKGRKIQLVEVSLRAGDTEVARAEALKVLTTAPG